ADGRGQAPGPGRFRRDDPVRARGRARRGGAAARTAPRRASAPASAPPGGCGRDRARPRRRLRRGRALRALPRPLRRGRAKRPCRRLPGPAVEPRSGCAPLPPPLREPSARRTALAGRATAPLQPQPPLVRDRAARGRELRTGRHAMSYRNRELASLVLVAILTGLGFASVYIARQDVISTASLAYAVFFLGLYLVAHAVTRIPVPFAYPYLLPLAGLLGAVGVIEIYRINSNDALRQSVW